MKSGWRAAGTAAIATAALMLAACGGGGSGGAGGEAGSTAGAALVLGSVNEPQSLDPGQAHVGHSLPFYQVTYDTLLKREPDGTLSPMLATKWSYDAKDTALTLELRTDVTFSDGEKFNAEAVKANFEHFKSDNGSQQAQLAAVKDVTVVDEDTVTINLSKPDPAMEYYLSQAAGFMGSPKALEAPGIDRTPVGSGPYVIDPAGTVVGSQYVFKKRDGYWNPELQKFDTITIKVLIDLTARVNALVSGQVDATLLDPKTGKQAEGAGMKLNASQVDWQGLLLYDRDGKINPALKDVQVRQAINHAFDRKTILEQQQLGRGTVTNQVFGPESGAYVDELDSLYPYDPAKAKQLLADAGYADGLTIKAPTIAGFDPLYAVLSQQLSDIGIELQTESIPPANYVADMAAGKYAVAAFNLFQGEPWVAINQMISTNALYNPFDSSTPELQKMIDAVQVGGDKNAELAKDVNRYVTEQAWFAPLYRLDQNYYTNSKKVTVVPQTQQAVPSIYNYTPVG
jgi:peptide/nickel transport system substrate-binding protein